MANNQSQQPNVTGNAPSSQPALPIVPDGFLNVITEQPTSGLMAKTFICSNYDLANQTHTYYMKVYGDDKVVINEMVGYILAKSNGLDVASKAYLLELGPITRALIDGFYSCHNIANSGEHYNSAYAFIISSAPGINISTYNSSLVIQTAFFKNRISNWSKNNMLIAFDEWVANTDRNAGNILFGAHANYVIDHGAMPVKMDWNQAELKSGECYKNVHFGNTQAVMSQPPLDDDILKESARHASTFGSAKKAIVDLITNTVTMNADYNHMIDFIETRSVTARNASYSKMTGAR